MSRRYSEDEARRIFARVAEQQARTPSPTAGLSLADLEEAAREAGLDPALVAAAAAEIDRPEATPPARLLGAPVEVTTTRIVPGTLTDDAWAQMVGAARREFGRSGTAGQIGPRREWTLVSGGTKNGVTTQLTAEPAPGGIRLTVSQSIRDMALGFSVAGAITGVLAVVFTVLALAGVDAELWIPAAILASQALLFTGGTQVGTRAWHRQRTGRFEALLDRMELAARPPAGAAEPEASPEPAPAGGGPLAALLDDPDERADDEAPMPRHRTRS